MHSGSWKPEAPEGDRRAPIIGRADTRATTEKIQQHFCFQRGLPASPRHPAFPGNEGQVRSHPLFHLCYSAQTCSVCAPPGLASLCSYLPVFGGCYFSRSVSSLQIKARHFPEYGGCWGCWGCWRWGTWDSIYKSTDHSIPSPGSEPSTEL